tara:strand:- start:3391 stop:3615 length:225 start_codon:yes stop_codon:yes gene_type:complete
MYSRVHFDSDCTTIHSIDNHIQGRRYELYSCGKFVIGLDSEGEMLDYVMGSSLEQYTILKGNKIYLDYNLRNCT